MIRPEDAATQPRIVRANYFGVTSIAMLRRAHDARFATRYFRGDGIDVGGGLDSLVLCKEFFPLVRHLFVYDHEHGDAQLLANVADQTFDFLYSSHCLEHLRDPNEALANWIRVIKPGGHLVIAVPDEDLYEQGHWPSRFNPDHRLSFTLWKPNSWSPVSVNVLDLVRDVAPLAVPVSLGLMDHCYRYEAQGHDFDQTRTPMAEAAIEFVLRKR
ncbi:MAG TPA: methyltransferase domain-containing protein [Acetobacteraceae bacterium]|nr:methyltransferase domain-containing protein [Acetobacteraceae bacterium]